MAMLSAAVWNIGLLAGLTAIYVPQVAASGSLMEYPLPVDGVLLLALLLANDSFWRTLLTARDRSPYVSIWYFGVALAAFTGLYGLATLAPLLDLSAAGDALANGFYARALETLRATGNPLYSSGLAIMAWVLWLGLATLAPLGALVDTSVPFVITQFGNVSTFLLVVPAFLVVANLFQTINGRWTLLLSPGTLPFAVVALTFLGATAMLEAIGSLGSVQALVRSTEWGVGVRLWVFFGTASLAFLALADHAFPRLLRRDWGGTLLAEASLRAAFAGTGLAGLALITGGIVHGSLLTEAATVDEITGTLFWFRLVLGGGVGLIGLAAVIVTLNVFLMYTSARRADYALVGEAVPAAGH
jgi:cbb3-type cytochrome oxidase subunit 1